MKHCGKASRKSRDIVCEKRSVDILVHWSDFKSTYDESTLDGPKFSQPRPQGETKPALGEIQGAIMGGCSAARERSRCLC